MVIQVHDPIVRVLKTR